MSRVETYIPLYRKYRPQSFADLVGQEAISVTLGNALEQSKVAHAYLFCGPRGTGKTSTARIFAKSLNCEQGPTVAPCQTCASCTGITQGNALDVIEFDAASNNKVEDARELIESCQFAPMAGRFKIYIIDEVHMLTPNAFNALLKTLEEPPPNVIFLFATTEAHKVLPTIISRCQRFDFNRITSDDIVGRLENIAQQESIQIEREALSLIARHARGGLRDAVGLLDQVAVMGRAKPDTVLNQKDLALLIGSLEEEVLCRLVDAIASREAAELVSQLTALINRGVEPTQLSKELIQHFRNLLVVKAAGSQANARDLSLSQDSLEPLMAQAQRFEPEELPQLLARLSSIDLNIRNTQQPHLWLEVGLLELTYREEIHMVKDLAKRVEQLEAQLAQGGVPQGAKPYASQPIQPSMAAPMPPRREAPPPAYQQQPVAQAPAQPAYQEQPAVAAQPVSVAAIMPAAVSGGGNGGGGELGAKWAQVCNMVASIPTKSLLKQHFFLVKWEGDEVTVGCASEGTLNILKKPDKFIHLQKAFEQVMGHAAKLNLVLEKNPNPAPMPAMESAPPPQQYQQPAAPQYQAPPSQPMAQTPVETIPEPAPVMAATAVATPPEAPQSFAQEPPRSPAMGMLPPMGFRGGLGPDPDDMPDGPLFPDEEPPDHEPLLGTPPQNTPPQAAPVSYQEASAMAQPLSQPVSQPMAQQAAVPESEPQPASVVDLPVKPPDWVNEPLQDPHLTGEWNEATKYTLELLQGRVMET